MLEIGPGPGAATGWLRERVAHLTALEADEAAAARLAARYPGSNVTVDTGDATADALWRRVVRLRGLVHHAASRAHRGGAVPDPRRGAAGAAARRDAARLRQPGQHRPAPLPPGDTYNPVDPSTLLVWLRTLGFSPVTITVGDVLMFTARKPTRASLS